jgi:hypothetical protein
MQMTLVPGSFFQSDTTGQKEAIILKPVDPATNAKIASAFYGLDSAGIPKQASVAQDGQSLSITVLNGITFLLVTVISPDPANAVIQLCQGATVLAEAAITNHSAVSTIIIQGT